MKREGTDDFVKADNIINRYKIARKLMPYISVECNDLIFFSESKDLVISDGMILSNTVWSKKEIDFFAEQNIGKGYFLDIGANIGTTCVYARKILPNCQFIAFEPMENNFKTLQLNCIANGFEDIKIEKIGLSNSNDTKYMILGKDNYGGSSVINSEKSMDNVFPADFITLDCYVKVHNIDVSKINYIWIDVEGHEPNVIEGALQTLKQSSAVVFMEYNIPRYIINGTYEKILKNLQELYSYYVCYEDCEIGNYEPVEIHNLRKLEELYKGVLCNILLFKKIDNYNSLLSNPNFVKKWKIVAGIEIEIKRDEGFLSAYEIKNDEFISKDEYAYLFYGPYKKIDIGKYRIKFMYDYAPDTLDSKIQIGTVDLNSLSNPDLLKEYHEPFFAGENFVVIDNVEIDKPIVDFEMRMFTTVSGVIAKKIFVERI